MTDTKKDNNQIPAILGVSNADGTTLLPFKADPTTHALISDDGTGGLDLSGDVAARDNNGIPAELAVSESDEITPVPLYANSSTGGILVDHT